VGQKIGRRKVKQAALEAFPEFTARLEGKVRWMYLDILGLVTTGLGCLIDPLSLAVDLPWKTKQGQAATRAEIVSEWTTVKEMTTLAKLGHKIAERYTRLRLTEDGIAELAKRRLESNEDHFRKVWPAWDEFPADAQLAIMSMGWAMGAWFTRTFKTFVAAVSKQDWAAAQQHCHIRETGNAGIIPRNKLNKRLFLDAGNPPDPELVTMFAPAVKRPPAFEAPISIPWVGITDEAWDEMVESSERAIAGVSA
jgi:GH24 family phage-related lysozyme (muramidase)